MLIRIVILVLSLIVLASCTLQEAVDRQNAINTKSYRNPHSTCSDCHGSQQPRAGSELFPKGSEPSLTCLDCHDYKENHHPVNFAPNRGAAIPFPLYQGEVRCLSCHEIHGGPAKAGTPKLLRGGPYNDRRTICFKCHNQETYASINPHEMIDAEGKIIELNGKPVCLLCHAVKPDPVVDRTADVRFRADVGFLCWRCHPPMPDSFFGSHFLVKPGENTLKYMHNTEKKEGVILPMVPRGRITCSTCHNPHQKRIMLDKSAAKGADEPHRIRLPYLCSACHIY